jgi:uncharacterized protein (DUF2147 family)
MPAVIAKVYAATTALRAHAAAGIGVALFALTPLAAKAQRNDLVGYWQEPSGSVVQVAPCGTEICAVLAQITKDAPTELDVHNPDPARHSQRLCGLRIGYGFHLTDPAHAEGGWLYDPRSGQTYHGEIKIAGKDLFLRGYIGIRLFGRTEIWTRVSAPKAGCS